MGDKYDQLWRCGFCGEWKVVPRLARDCEERHLMVADEAPESP